MRKKSLAWIENGGTRGRELCQEVLEAAWHAKGMRARPRGLAVGTREGAGTKKISKAKLMELSERLNTADEGEISSSCESGDWQRGGNWRKGETFLNVSNNSQFISKLPQSYDLSCSSSERKLGDPHFSVLVTSG